MRTTKKYAFVPGVSLQQRCGKVIRKNTLSNERIVFSTFFSLRFRNNKFRIRKKKTEKIHKNLVRMNVIRKCRQQKMW